MRGGEAGNASVDARDQHAISKPRRPRWTPSEDAKALLETIFTADSFPTFSVRNQLAEQLQIDSRQVQIWFQNRRQRERLRTGQQQALEERDAALAADRSRSAWAAEGHAPPNEAAPRGGVGHVLLPRPDAASDSDLRDAGERPPHTSRARCSSSLHTPPAPAARAPAERARACPPGVKRLAEAGLKAEDVAGEPTRLEGAALAGSLSPSAGSDETARTTIVYQAAPFSLAAPAAALPAACAAGSSHDTPLAPDATAPAPAAPSRTVELPGGGTVDLPAGAPPALRQMFDTPGGSRALQLAARSLLRNNPILQHPGAARSSRGLPRLRPSGVHLVPLFSRPLVTARDPVPPAQPLTHPAPIRASLTSLLAAPLPPTHARTHARARALGGRCPVPYAADDPGQHE